jgi:uncharacterized membrane protein
VGKPRRYRVQQRELARRQQQAAAATGGHLPPPQNAVSFRGQVRHYTGPLPPPEILREYDAILPGAADRILKNFETESDHRRSLEKDESDAGTRFMEKQLGLLARGQKFGLVVVIAGFATAAYSVHVGAAITGAVIGTVDIVALVALFITGKRGKQQPTLPPAQAPPNSDGR